MNYVMMSDTPPRDIDPVVADWMKVQWNKHCVHAPFNSFRCVSIVRYTDGTLMCEINAGRKCTFRKPPVSVITAIECEKQSPDRCKDMPWDREPLHHSICVRGIGWTGPVPRVSVSSRYAFGYKSWLGLCTVNSSANVIAEKSFF